MEMILWGLIGLLSLLLSVLSWQDIRQRILSNKLVLIVLFVVVPLAGLLYHTLYWQTALITLIVGFILFLFNIIGAGDIKLLSVLMLLVPPTDAFGVLFLISLFGLLLIIIGWIGFRQSIKQNGLPYGVAISLGFLSYLFLFQLVTF